MFLLKRITLLFVLSLFSVMSFAYGVSENDLSEAKKWTYAKFFGEQIEVVGVNMLEVVANNDPVQKNQHNGWALRIGDKTYSHGLYCHAYSKIIVHLAKPARTFSAVVGIDNNHMTINAESSVEFVVSTNGKEAYRSKVFKSTDEGESISVNLNGQREFVLEVTDGGDGINADQANWANATVTFEDGTSMRLGDMPFSDYVTSYTTELPFTFVYDGKKSSELLPNWITSRAKKALDANRTEHTLLYTDPVTGLEVRCVAVEYADYPTVEWTVYFKNNGRADTPTLEDVRALNIDINANGPDDFLLHYNTGSPARIDDYAPHEMSMTKNSSKRFAGAWGRPTGNDWSYFNLENNGGGAIIVVGWPGQWDATFSRKDDNKISINAGQETLKTILHPGEEIRTPLMVMQFWSGRWVDSQNTWRRWMMDYNVPRPFGEQIKPQLEAASSHYFAEMAFATEENQIEFIDAWLDNNIFIDYWWMDAGWYPCDGAWPNVGTWEVDRERFPRGIKPISDHAHSRGVKTLLWFEPERVTANTWLTINHPEWVIGGAGGGLLDLGNEEALNWLINHVNKFLKDNNLDLYRQDFNMGPLSYWQQKDTPDRQGITENKHVVGYLKYWDSILEQSNGMIDACASGGMRNDLETMRRAVSLHRSDYILEPVGTQSHSYGISLWLPYSGAGAREIDPYVFRSNMHPAIVHNADARNSNLDIALMRKLINEWRQIADYYLKDFYPLTKHSTANDVWLAWQFDDPEKGAGVVQAFRRADCAYHGATFKLEGLEPDSSYLLRDFDEGSLGLWTGRELMEDGLPINLKKAPQAAIITYEKI